MSVRITIAISISEVQDLFLIDLVPSVAAQWSDGNTCDDH